MIIIGEKINGTVEGVRSAILDRDAAYIGDLAEQQAAAGADHIDVNVGTGIGDESEAMVWALGVIRDRTDAPLCIDSSDPDVIAAGISVIGREGPFINSVTGAAASLEKVLPLAVDSSSPLVALAMDEAGIPSSADERLEVIRRVVTAADAAGIAVDRLYVDPLVMPLSADFKQGRVTLETLRAVKAEFEGIKTIMAVSNASFGIPIRSLINRSMLTVAVYMGLDAAIIDPTDNELRAAISAAVVVAGGDKYCKDYMKAYRAGSLR
jgi:cobalamin-dependent methionine synthase I